MRCAAHAAVCNSGADDFMRLAAYYISYGPHGPRSPIVPANSGGKVILGSIACFGLAAGLFALARYNGKIALPHACSFAHYAFATAHETPKTMNKEWKEAQDEYARSQKMDPCAHCFAQFAAPLTFSPVTALRDRAEPMARASLSPHRVCKYAPRVWQCASTIHRCAGSILSFPGSLLQNRNGVCQTRAIMTETAKS